MTISWKAVLGSALLLAACAGTRRAAPGASGLDAARVAEAAARARRLFGQGVAQGRAGDLGGARASFEQAWRADSSLLYAGFNVGAVCERAGDLACADAAYREV